MIKEQKTSTAGDVIAIAPFGITRKDQHLIDDDAWYARFLMEHVKQFIYVAGAHSASSLIDHFRNSPDVSVISLPNFLGRLQYEFDVVRCLCKQLQGRRAAQVIFFGYSERMVLLAAPFLLSQRCRVILVNTNNLSKHRLKKYRWPMYAMHLLLWRRITRFIVHTAYEKNLLLSYFPFLKTKTVLKKHHMLAPDPSISALSASRKPADRITISCFGPITPDKSTEVISALIRQLDTTNSPQSSIDIRIFKIDPEELPTNLPKNENISISYFDAFLEVGEYRKKVRESDLVVMLHTPAFEGKLSGIFCDCVALGVPFLALGIEPLLSFYKQHGGIGFLLHPDDRSCWQEQIALATDPAQLAIMRNKIIETSRKFQKNELDADYLRAFDLQLERSRV